MNEADAGYRCPNLIWLQIVCNKGLFLTHDTRIDMYLNGTAIAEYEDRIARAPSGPEGPEGNPTKQRESEADKE